MIGVSVFIIIAVCAEWSSAQFLNHRPYPTYSLENMPDTGFSCRDKILGGYYADPETQCQMFHVCVKVSGVGVQDFRFLCSNGTAFDQDHQICADWQDVDCDATTLYYSSDNFDLYRIGSGFESKAVKYGEDEEPFSLQRAETGDVRINREHQAQRINQQRENYNYRPSNNQQHNTNRNSYNSNNSEKDIFKSSSSSNFFNNRNGGKETDDDDYESGGNQNQDNDQYQRRKLSGRKQNRRPINENSTERPRPNGFSNNFAGSSYLPSSTTVRSTPVVTENPQYNPRTRPRARVSPQYNNADNFRQSTGKGYEDDGRYRGENNNNNNGQYNRNFPTTQYAVSTPTPFKQYNGENSTPRYNFNPSTSSAPQTQARSTENYPSAFSQPQQRYQNAQRVTENYPSTNLNKQENYQTASVQTQTQTREAEIYRNTAQQQQQQQYYKDQYETTKVKPYESYPTAYNTQTKKPTTPFKQAENYPTTYSPKQTKDFKNVPYTQQSSTYSPETNPTYTQGNQQPTTYNRPSVSIQHTPPVTNHQQQDTVKTTFNTSPPSSQPTINQHPTFKQTPIYNSAPIQRQTPQYTQYTPTVPRITTPYHSSTTPAIPRRSNRFDETQYDDGSYNSKYDNEDDKRDEEFLKAAHSINIASSRNEYNQNSRNAPSTTQKPRPFSVTPAPYKPTENLTTHRPNVSKQSPPPPATNNYRSTAPAKKVKDVSYDYAYYDTNVGSDHEYDIAVDIEKSVKSKKQ
ncbi:hypothetical protein PPYR_12011 [Photinus pyralis]|uniref:Chitin-binding type-2 domain-containing protein n=1 Tax=Photinus pyralis TaxID=7054 RepID=A0A1Y1LMH6_PHOPY|nr:uncharacterized protein DDB_G0292186-like [Photinus pyralis]KAB0795172.1 hypothetical protein PPYR_12011 [Photinus pyralis]